MNYELSVKGQKVDILRSAKSLVDCHMLRQQYNRSLNQTPVKKIQNFEFQISQLAKTQGAIQLSTNRSRRTLISSQQNRNEKSEVNSKNFQLFEGPKVNEKPRSQRSRIISPINQIPNFQFNLNYHIKMLKQNFEKLKEPLKWQDFTYDVTPRIFTNRVYKLKKNNPQQQFYIECTKRIFD